MKHVCLQPVFEATVYSFQKEFRHQRNMTEWRNHGNTYLGQTMCTRDLEHRTMETTLFDVRVYDWDEMKCTYYLPLMKSDKIWAVDVKRILCDGLLRRIQIDTTYQFMQCLREVEWRWDLICSKTCNKHFSYHCAFVPFCAGCLFESDWVNEWRSILRPQMCS